MSPPRVRLLALALLAAGCAGGARATRGSTLPPPAAERRAGTLERGAGPAPGSPRRTRARSVPHDVAVRRAIDTAAGLVGRREIVVDGVRYGDGCAALVRAAFAEAGRPLADDADPAALLALARSRGGTRRSRPAPGDVAFLADRPGGPAEHVGLVASVSPEGTAIVVHQTERRGVARVRVTPAQPWKARTDAGKVLNDVLLVGAGRVTAGRLLVGYATLL